MRSARRILLPALIAVTFSGCAATYRTERLDLPDDLGDMQSKSVGDVMVSVAVLTDEQAQRHFGVDFAGHELQALWISVRNGSDRRLWLIRNVLDPDFYSAEEVALLAANDVQGDARGVLHQHLRDESIRALLLPMTITEGFVFLPRVEGGRYIDIRLQGDAYVEGAGKVARAGSPGAPPRELRFEFAVPLPDGDFDYERLDPGKTYGEGTLPTLTLEQLRATLEQLPCCATDEDGNGEGDPLNIVLIGGSAEVLTALTRSGWSFTHRITLNTIRREVGAAVAGKPYAVAPVSSLFVFGRKQDVAMQRARRSIAQRNHLRLWLAPFLLDDRQVWVGQISRDIGVKVTTQSPTLTTHVIDPEVDTTREYLLHSLVAEGFVDQMGFVRGSAEAGPAEPRHNLTGDPYYSDGMRLVVILAREPIAPDRIRSLQWEQSAAPIAEGQSEAAKRYVRPIVPTSGR